MKQAFLSIALLFGFLVNTAIAQAEATEPFRGGVLNGRAINLPKPLYPADAKAAGLQGSVYVDVVVDESGSVISAMAATDVRKAQIAAPDGSSIEIDIPPADPILRDASEKAAMQAKFVPVKVSGKPVQVRGTVIYNFVASTDSGSSINGGVLNGKAINLPSPEYPAAARAVGADGRVVVQIIIDEQGAVTSAKAISGHPSCGQPRLRPQGVRRSPPLC